MASREPREGACEEARGRGRRGEEARRHVHDQVSEFLRGLEVQSMALSRTLPGDLEGEEIGVFARDERGREADEDGGQKQVSREHGLESTHELGEGNLGGLGGGEGFTCAEELVRELRTGSGGGEAVNDVGRALGEVAERGVCGE